VVTNPHGYLTKLDFFVTVSLVECFVLLMIGRFSSKKKKDGRTQVLANEESLKRADH
jgi:hypothetical protein